jgi:TolA-binding protein
VAIYAHLLTADGEHANAWQYEIGNTLRAFGRHQEAIAAYRLCDNFPECYIQMAWSHRDLAQYNEALALYLQIISGHEASAPWALLQIGYTYEQMGEKEKAIKSFQQVCKKFPKTGQASEAHVRLNDVYKITVTLGGATDE